MDYSRQDLDALTDIKKMMERSSRFISLSGWSGIAAGICGLAGAFIARNRILENDCAECLKSELMIIAVVVFIAAFITAILFTYFKSKKEQVPIWGLTARRLIWNTLLPMIAGAIFILRLINTEDYNLIIPASLIFYGLALINGSKYTMGEVRFLGYAQLITGLISLWFTEYGLIFWAIGFGFYHIIYGIAMWWKYERKPSN